ncbi:MAG: histidine kinase [Gammaproteobacteria bacterium]|nr:histidine kinase [Gammaproteobacteria bacterium]
MSATLSGSHSKSRPHAEVLANFWVLQCSFWIGVAAITFLSLTLWYGAASWHHLGHTVLQSLAGLLLSVPLHYLYLRTWAFHLLPRVLISLAAVVGITTLWSLFRVATFAWLTGESHVWEDFGGWYFAGFFIFLCWSSLYYGSRYFYLLQREHQRLAEVQADVAAEQVGRLRAEAETKDAQLKMLRYQLNPHFLFNTLNAMSGLVQTGKPERAQQMIVQLSRFLRYSLDNNPDLKLPLHREVDALLMYLEIEKTRFGDRLQIDFNIEDDTRSALIPSLLLQPLIENSMKYAVAKSETGGTIKLRSSIEDNALVLTLSDSGTGKGISRSKIKSADGRGIGLRNTVERLNAFYGQNYSFDLCTSSSGGLKTTIRIPWQTSEQGAHAAR